jgi:hypothetical protein
VRCSRRSSSLSTPRESPSGGTARRGCPAC